MLQWNQKQISTRIFTLAVLSISRQACLGAIIVMAWGLVAGVVADELPGADKALNISRTRALLFPAEKCMGSLSIEDPSLGSSYAESGRDLSYPFGFDPVRVCLAGDWDFVGLAQGDIVVPADRNIQLNITLGPRRDDLSFLSELGPSDLYKLRISSSTRRFSANRPALESISHLTDLQILCLHQTGVTSRQMSSLKSLSSLRALLLGQELSFGSAGLAVLKDLPALEYLDCDTGATDTGLKHLGQLPNLRWLRMRMGSIRGPGLAYLTNLPRLERLCLWGNGLTDQHLRYLEGLTHIKSLTLWGTDFPLTDVSLTSISKLTALEELHFIRIQTNFTYAGIAHLTGLNNLKKIGLSGSKISDAGVRHLAALPRLESITGVSLTGEGLKVLASCRNLKCLSVRLERIGARWGGSPMDVAHLAALGSLEELKLTGSMRELSDENLARLESLSRLKDLTVFTKDITERGWASIGKLRQLESLTLYGKGNQSRVTKRGLNHLNGLTNLQTLDLNISSGATSVIDDTPLNLTALTNLKTVELIGLSLQESDLEFLAGLDHLEWLKLQNYGVLSENALRYIKNLPELKRLHIVGLTCTDGNGLAHLRELRKLESMTLIGRITDVALGRLGGLPSICSLKVETDEPIRPETVARLKQDMPMIKNIHIDRPPQTMQPANLQSREQQERIRVSPSRVNQPMKQNRRRRR